VPFLAGGYDSSTTSDAPSLAGRAPRFGAPPPAKGILKKATSNPHLNFANSPFVGGFQSELGAPSQGFLLRQPHHFQPPSPVVNINKYLRNAEPNIPAGGGPPGHGWLGPPQGWNAGDRSSVMAQVGDTWSIRGSAVAGEDGDVSDDGEDGAALRRHSGGPRQVGPRTVPISVIFTSF